LTIAVAGSDDTAVRPAVSLGEHSFIRSLLAAPHGTISFADCVHARGAYAGFDLEMGEHVHVDFESGFPTDVTGQGGSQRLSGYFGVYPDPTVAPVVGPVPASTNISLSIGLPVRDPQGLKSFIKQVSDPKSPNFRKYLTQTEFRSTYGATDSDEFWECYIAAIFHRLLEGHTQLFGIMYISSS
jgi:Pro-kumamolisin, activation domain